MHPEGHTLVAYFRKPKLEWYTMKILSLSTR